MKIIKTASKTIVKMSYSEWVAIGKQAGWAKDMWGKITGKKEKPTLWKKPDQTVIKNMFNFIQEIFKTQGKTISDPQNIETLKQLMTNYIKDNNIVVTVEDALKMMQNPKYVGTLWEESKSKKSIRQDKFTPRRGSDERFVKISIEEFEKMFKI